LRFCAYFAIADDLAMAIEKGFGAKRYIDGTFAVPAGTFLVCFIALLRQNLMFCVRFRRFGISNQYVK